MEPPPHVQAEVDAYLGPPGLVTCQRCGVKVADRLFIRRKHLETCHDPGAAGLTVRQIMKLFR